MTNLRLVIFRHNRYGMQNFLTFGRLFMNALCKLFALLLLIFSFGCSSDIDPQLQEQIDLKSYSTEELFEIYEDLNEELVDIIEEKDYNYKKLLKAKNAFRTSSTRRYNRQTRIAALESPKVAEGEVIPDGNGEKINAYKEKLIEYDEEISEAQEDVDKYTALTKELTEKAIKLRESRNKAYDAYIASREELKVLNKKAEEQRKQ